MTTNPEEKLNRTVFDTNGHPYEITGELGRGGQGAVCKTRHPGVLVKISLGQTGEKQAAWLDHVRWIMRQPLEGLNVAKPVALVDKPRGGYVMELMDGLVPLDGLVAEASESMLEGKGLEGFLRTGGLKRRVTLLAKLARLLSELHGKGLAFGDLSPSNVFISSDVQQDEVWLIDCDNLCVSSRHSEQSIYTPDYGAPEILSGQSGVTTLSDSWSFAVIAFQLLSLAHPLKGDMVNDGDPALEERALMGELPWVDHPEDRSNSLSTGLPREIVATSRIRALFERCFNIGKDDPGQRPTLACWAEAFEAAQEICIECVGVGCQSSFFAEKSSACTFCDYRQPKEKFLSFVSYLFYPEGLGTEEDEAGVHWIQSGHVFIMSLGESRPLRRSPPTSSLFAQSEEVCQVSFTEKGLLLEPSRGANIFIARPGGALTPVKKQVILPTGKRRGERLSIHLGDVEEEHAAWVFKW